MRPQLSLAVLLSLSLVGFSASTAEARSELARAYRVIASKSFIDLTHSFGPQTPVWSGFGQAKMTPAADPKTHRPYTIKEDGFRATLYELVGQYGTHVDPPAHFDEKGTTMDEIPLKQMILPLIVLDDTPYLSQDPNHAFSVADLDSWEKKHGRIPRGAWLLLRTGWSKRTDPAYYINLGDDGPHTPGFVKECSDLLARDRDVLGVGVETVGTDAGRAATFDPPFPNHYVMHGSGKFGLAGLCNLDQLPPTGAVIIAAPLKIVNGSGSPLRVIAITPQR